MKPNDKNIQESRNRIDDYLNTVYAIIGFLNVYKYELEKIGKEIVIFQGRKLFLDESSENLVTPDLGLCISETDGLVGEVKYSFPANQELWINTFQQIKKYDNILRGWPTESASINNFDIVLLVQQSRSRAVIDYYLKELKEEDKINRTFAILEFNRSSQGKEYFHFRIEYGNVSNSEIQDKLQNGLYVPFEIYLNQYSTVKIYDVEPPLPLLFHLIYECVIDKLKGEGNFKKLTKKAKQLVIISSQELTHRLREVYSFKSLQSEEYLEGQPEFPKHEWVKTALEKLSEIGEGTWLDKNSGEFSYVLTQKEGNILEYYIKMSLSIRAIQPELFS